MKNVIVITIITPILLFCQITENLSAQQPMNKKLYAKGAFIFGPGFESIKVGEKYYEDSDKDSEDINVMPGGGFGIEGVIGYNISTALSFELSVAMQNSGDVVNEDESVTFSKSLLRASILYKFPSGKKYIPYIGAGISSVLSAKYKEDTSAGEYEVTYTKPFGFHIIGGAEWKNPGSPWFFYGEARLVILGEFEYDESDFDEWILEEFGMDKMTANGVQFSFGVGYYIN